MREELDHLARFRAQDVRAERRDRSRASTMSFMIVRSPPPVSVAFIGRKFAL